VARRVRAGRVLSSAFAAACLAARARGGSSSRLRGSARSSPSWRARRSPSRSSPRSRRRHVAGRRRDEVVVAHSGLSGLRRQRCRAPRGARGPSPAGCRRGLRAAPTPPANPLTRGPMFGALMELLARPAIPAGAAVHPDLQAARRRDGLHGQAVLGRRGFTAAEIRLVSVNIGLVLSIAGASPGPGSPTASASSAPLWILGPRPGAVEPGLLDRRGHHPAGQHTGGAPIRSSTQAILYAASATESFTGGLGTAAFLAFLMAIAAEGACRHRVRAAVVGLRAVALGRRLGGGLGRRRWGTATGSCSPCSSPSRRTCSCLGAADAPRERRARRTGGAARLTGGILAPGTQVADCGA